MATSVTVSLAATTREIQVCKVGSVVTKDVDYALTAGAATLSLDATGVDWCYRFTEHGPGGRTRYCVVPDVGSVAYADLVDVDPATFMPAVEPPVAAWSAATQAALDAATAASALAGTKVGKGDIVFNVRDYGALGTFTGASGSDDTVAILAAAAALQAAAASGTLFFPPRPAGQSYRCTSPLPSVSGIRVAGAGRQACRVRFVGCDMFAVASGTLSSVIVEGLNITISGGHMFNLGGNSLTFSRVSDCQVWVASDDRSIVSAAGNGSVIENWFENLDLYRNATHAVPAFDIVNGSGAANANVWKRIRANSANCTSSPFWRIEASVTGTYAYDNTFEDIVGEQNPGGLIHLYSASGAFVRNCYDWDATTAYVNHVIKVDRSTTSTTESRAITAINAGRRGGTLSGGAQDFYASPGSREVSLTNVGNHTATAVVTVPQSSSTIQGRAGFTVGQNDWVRTGRNTTGNRPSASSSGAGAIYFDTTLNKIIASDGTNWRDAMGSIV